LPIEIFFANELFSLCFVDSPYSSTKIPYAKRPFVLSVVDCSKAMSLVAHANSKLRDLNYDSFCIEIVPAF
jgi:hypothetical protein